MQELGELAEMVQDEAPRLFAVVEELGEEANGDITGEIAGWGMAFADHAEVVCDGGRSWLSVSSPDRACWLLSPASDGTARLVWVTPPATG